MQAYKAPEIRCLGSIVELTQQNFNKIGASSDFFTTIGLPLVGDIVPVSG